MTCRPLIERHYLAVNHRIVWQRCYRLYDAGYHALKSLPFREREWTLPAFLKARARYPSRLIS